MSEAPAAEAPAPLAAAPTIRRARLVVLTLAALIIGADQVTKHWAVSTLQPSAPRHVVWTLQWNLTFNRGMAFSAGQGAGVVIGAVAVVVAIAVLVYVARSTSRLTVAAAGFIVGGALGNVVDRLFRGEGWLRGAVVDFVDFQWFPIFNVADMAINVGAGLYLLWALLDGRRQRGPARP